MKLSFLRDFMAVAEMGSLRAAARSLGLSQSSMTKSIQRLEQELGAPLFNRSTEGISLTAPGRAFLVRAKAATQELRRGEEEVTLLSGGTGGTLAFGISAASALLLAPDVISGFLRRNPAVKARISGGVYSTVMSQLREGLLEFSIGPRPSGDVDAAFVIHELFRSDRVVAARKDHPLSRATSLHDLLDAEWMISGASGLDLSNHEAMFNALGLRAPPVRVQSDYMPVYLSLLASSDLLMILPKLWLDSPMVSDSLVSLPVREALPSAEICVVQKRGLGLTPVAERLLNEIRRAAESYMRELR